MLGLAAFNEISDGENDSWFDGPNFDCLSNENDISVISSWESVCRNILQHSRREKIDKAAGYNDIICSN